MPDVVSSPLGFSEPGLTLFFWPTSTCSQKVRIVLAEKGIPFTGRILDWKNQEQVSDWYLRINPNGVVPSIVHDGQTVTDSSAIIEYLDEVFPQPALSPVQAVQRAKMRAWMRYFEEVPTVAIRIPSFNRRIVKVMSQMPRGKFDAITAKLPLRKYFYQEMGQSGFSEQRYAQSVEMLQNCLRRVDAALDDGRKYLLGDDLTLADVVLIPTVVRMEDLGLSDTWRDFGRFSKWYQSIQQRPSFAAVYTPSPGRGRLNNFVFSEFWKMIP